MVPGRVRIALAGGGTGGHVYPALAIAEIAGRELGDVDLLYIGVQGRAEEHIVPRAGIPIRFVRGRGLSSSPVGLALFAADLARGSARALQILRSFDPHLLVATGGYSSAPAVLAASALRAARRRPAIVVHEQNAAPGRANRLAARFADRVMTTFESSGRFFRSDRTVHSGYPVRSDIGGRSRDDERARLGVGKDAFVLLAFGGSGGARAINRAIAGALPRLLERPDVHVIHGTGRYLGADYDPAADTQRVIAGLGLTSEALARYRPHPYIEDMGAMYAAADLVVCRSGAGTLSEIQQAGLPAVLVPKIGLPHEHQLANARDFESRGAARVIVETDDPAHPGLKRVDADELADCLLSLVDAPRDLEALRDAVTGIPRPDTEGIVAQILTSLL